MILLCVIVIVTGWIVTGLVWIFALCYAATKTVQTIFPARVPSDHPWTVCGSQRRCHKPRGRGGVWTPRRVSINSINPQTLRWLAFHRVLT